MGLSVKVYVNIKPSEFEEDADFVAYVMQHDWKHRIKNLEYDKGYNGDVLVGKGVNYGYSSHNRFRESLMKVMGRADLLDGEGKIKWSPLPKDLPFYDLIWFADNEGCLDWEISETIHADFVLFDKAAKKILSDYEYNIYKTWMETFAAAKANGVVVFC